MMQRLGPLISTSNLLRALKSGNKNIRLLDATMHTPKQNRDACREFEEKHILGATFFNIKECSNSGSRYEHMLPSEGLFADYVGEHGIDNNTQVVVYDAYNSFITAARVWWMFRVFGHEKVSVLEGGLEKWEVDGLPTSNEKAAATKKKFDSQFKSHLWVGYEEMVKNIQEKMFQVVDVRPAEQFHGENENHEKDLGRANIVGSINIPYTSLIQENGLEFKKPDDTLRIFQEKGIDLSLPLTTTCMRGIKACSVALAAAAVVGKSDVAVYDGSWQEFSDRYNKAD